MHFFVARPPVPVVCVRGEGYASRRWNKIRFTLYCSAVTECRYTEKERDLRGGMAFPVLTGEVTVAETVQT